MQEHETAYGFHPRKIINPQVISVKWQEKKYSEVVFGRDKRRRKQENYVTSALSSEISALVNTLNPLIMRKLKHVQGPLIMKLIP